MGIAPAQGEVALACCIGRRHRPAADAIDCKLQAVNVASFVLSESIVGFMISATPGIASTLSNS
jgi:hypothetical protein